MLPLLTSFTGDVKNDLMGKNATPQTIKTNMTANGGKLLHLHLEVTDRPRFSSMLCQYILSTIK